jgi:hypothetical protein
VLTRSFDTTPGRLATFEQLHALARQAKDDAYMAKSKYRGGTPVHAFASNRVARHANASVVPSRIDHRSGIDR